MNNRMLEGYKILDLTQIVAGPTCARMLAEQGAEVIKLELAPFGDRTRVGGLRARSEELKKDTQSTYFFQQNHSKRSLALDFKHPDGVALIKRLVKEVDVLIENFSPGVMARAGLSYDQLRKIHPGLVMCSISLAGQTGPLSKKPGYDYVAQAYAGITDLIGDPEREPALITMAMGDTSTGIAAAMAVGFALLHRERTGEGQLVEASLLDTYFHMHEVAMPRVSLRRGYTPTRTGSQHPDGGPTGIFRCADGTYVTVATLPHQWKQFAEAIGLPELLADPRFASASLRRDNNDALKVIFEAWLAKFPTRGEAIAHLDAHRIPVAPVLTLNEAMAHPHMRERGTVRDVHDPALGTFAIPGSPVRFSAWKKDEPIRAARLGEHNEEILQDYFGLTTDEIERLYSEGVLVQDPLVRARAGAAEQSV